MVGSTNSKGAAITQKEGLLISMKTNQSSSETLIGKVIEVVLDGERFQYTWEGIDIVLSAQAGMEYSVIYPTVDNYKTPDVFSSVVDGGKKSIVVGVYESEKVSLALYTDDGTALGSQTVYVDEVDSNGNPIQTDEGYSMTFITLSEAVVFEVPCGKNYRISVSKKNGYNTPDSYQFMASGPSRQVEMVYRKKVYKITSIRINQGITDPSGMITVLEDDGGIYEIRDNSHRYTGVLDENGVMQLRQLDDTDSRYYLDGTSSDLTTLGTDVWMKLPAFWYKCSEYTTDIWNFSVAYGEQPDDSYKLWDGKDLIGVYEAYVAASKSYSTSGRTSKGSLSPASFVSVTSARGTGFSLVKWKHHCMMAMLFYTYYKTTNCRAICGEGTSSYTKKTGGTNALGMEDTVAGGNGDSGSINFWGLENWWGNKDEFIGNVTVSNQVFTVEEDDGTTRIAGTKTDNNDCIMKMLFGENIDLIPTLTKNSPGYKIGFCGSATGSGTGTYICERSGNANSSANSICHITTSMVSSGTSADAGSRLAYRGNYVIL